MVKAYKIAATALCFSLFYAGGLLLSLVWFNLLHLCIRDELRLQQLSRRSIQLSFKCFIGMLCFLRLIKVKCAELDKLQQAQGLIIACNHPSLIDYVIMTALLDDLNCVFKAELTRSFFLHGVIKGARYLSNADPQKLFTGAGQCISRGEKLLIFPEGTRTVRGQPLKLHRGTAALCVKLNCPLYVVGISCTQELLSKERRWYDIPAHTPCYHIEPLQLLNKTDFISDESEQDLDPLIIRRMNRTLTSLLQSAADKYS